MQENDFGEKSPVDSADNLRVKNFVEIALSRSVSEINMFSCFIQNFKMAVKSLWENDFCEKSPVDSADNLRVKNFVEIALSRSVSEINMFSCFIQNFKMAVKSLWENDFCEKSPVDSADNLRVKNFVEIALSRSVSEINMFSCFIQNFKMAVKRRGKTIFAKSRQ